MSRYNITILEVCLHLPQAKCQLKFMVKHSNPQPRIIQQISLGNAISRLSLNEDIVFMVPQSGPTQQTTVTVYIVGITKEQVIHVGLFTVDLGLANHENDFKAQIQGCNGQNGLVLFRLAGIRETEQSSELIRRNMASQSQSVMESESDFRPKSDDGQNKNQQSVSDWMSKCSQLQQQNEALNQRLAYARDQLFQMRDVLEGIMDEKDKAIGQIGQLKVLNQKLVDRFNVVVTQSIQLQQRLQGRMTQGDVSETEQIKREMYDKGVQTDYAEPIVAQQPGLFRQRNSIEYYVDQYQATQKQVILQSDADVLREEMQGLVSRQRINNAQFLGKINDMVLQEALWELQYSHNRVRSYERTLRKMNYPIYKLQANEPQFDLGSLKLESVTQQD